MLDILVAIKIHTVSFNDFFNLVLTCSDLFEIVRNYVLKIAFKPRVKHPSGHHADYTVKVSFQKANQS